MNQEHKIVLYQVEDTNIYVNVMFKEDTFWMTQKAMADLFECTTDNISLHLKNIYKEEELDENRTTEFFSVVQNEGQRNVKRKVKCYNLDAIIAVGYRVNSKKATRFRQWATKTLKEYITKGFVLNDDMLKNGRPFGKDYFDELLERIREIRASERRAYQKITDVFEQCSYDYDKNSEIRYKDQEQQKYAYEKNIHPLIFPMTKTSDDIDYLQHNLWIIDEKLAYHHYLASDMKIKKMEEVENNSGKEPDLIIFDSPFAFTDEEEQPYRNITIIEFKRPGREHYNDAENPIRQIKEYMDDIVEGKVKTKDGEFLNGTENIRFFCYIICDVDLSIKKLAKLEDLKVTPDNMGFYKYIDSYKAYLEIIPYNKLIQDSKKRNRILFDKLFNQS